jgi:hypothetical protein
MRRTTSHACSESIRNRCRVLVEALQSTSHISSKILDACESQSTLASLSIPSEGITALSRNSLYKYADLELTDARVPNGYKDEGAAGYRYLDWLRNEIKKKGKQGSFDRSRSAHASRFQQRFQELTSQMIEVRQHSLAVSRAYLHLFTSVRGLHADESVSATTRQRVANMMNDHDRLYSELFEEVGSLRPDNLEAL